MDLIESNSSIGVLDADAIPQTETKQYQLPGARFGERDFLSGKQVRVIVNWVQRTLPSDMSWEDAIAEARKRFVRGNQYDFNIVAGIVNADRAENAHEPLSPQQNQLAITILKALDSGPDRAPHWEPNIERKIGNLPAAVRNTWFTQLATLSTRGEFSTFMDKFNALCGTPQPRPGDADIEKMAADAQAAADGESGNDEEPF